jgi:hypothetical protein
MWEVHYSQEAATYLEDYGALITDLFLAMEALADSAGIPRLETVEEIQGLTYWLVQDHLVMYRRLERVKIVRILAIKPV